ncbi:MULTISPECIES: hypothetical protein [Bradyrhizobium]|uniref:hypothetical protein n=1 Tax=Bradyrhizobium elkanii TaxID=29448 RepID=UPI0012BB87AB|nr:hypothetical protein [Bradyrhizobium elkanii]
MRKGKQLRVVGRGARFRRNGDGAMWGYVECIMTYVVDIDPRIARFCLHAGRLHAGT